MHFVKRNLWLILIAGLMAAINSCSEVETKVIGSACDENDCDPDYCGVMCNPDYLPSSGGIMQDEANLDSDGDTVPDAIDNCPFVINDSQADSNDDGIGDACTDSYKRDGDGDTIPDNMDNCPSIPNSDQADTDNNGIGDVCSVSITDLDNDTIPDVEDNCPKVANPNQEDANHDGVGDACDTAVLVDADGDTIPDTSDNCPDTPNADQADSNRDGIGDACSVNIVVDSDNDTIPDDSDSCPFDKTNACQENGNGSPESPFVIQTSCVTTYKHSGDTSQSANSLIDFYPNFTSKNESGFEYYYKITIEQRSQISIWLDAGPNGVDIDVHLLRNLNIADKTVPAADFIDRNDKAISQIVDPGTYWIVADTYNGNSHAGSYTLNVQVMPEYAGTKTDPILVNCGNPLPADFVLADVRSTADASSSVFETYPGFESIKESGPEYIYKFTLKERARFHANIRKPEPANTDIDLHLLSSLDPVVVSRNDCRIWQTLDPGTYYLVADSFGGKKGKYFLDIQTRPVALTNEHVFNDYILKAVNWIKTNYGLKGYELNSAYTHDLAYGSNTIPKGPYAPKTMCVAAVAETILVAMDLYAQETGDISVWEHIPWKSWYSMRAGDMRTCMWVNHEYKCEGSGDAVTLFGMGMNVPFEELIPGSLLNLNRESGTGHAVIFISFLDSDCKEYSTYNSNVVGFKYFSSQGGSSAGKGGFDYRYATFKGSTMGTCPGKKDTGIYRRSDQLYLNTGVMYMPKYWQKTTRAQGL